MDRVNPNRMIEWLSSLKVGEAGKTVRQQELMELDIPGISEFDIQARAEWIRAQLPFPSEISKSATVSDYSFRRLDALGGKP